MSIKKSESGQEKNKVLHESDYKIRSYIDNAPDGDINALELSDIIDTEILQDMMENFYNLTGMLGAVLDVSGKVLVAVGWQDICTKFHRCNPETLKNCIESDTILTKGIPEGTFKSYRCKNNLWDIATPIMVEGRHVGNIFMGQYFLEGELPDVELFRKQARKYGFDEEEYLAALDRVPHFSKEIVDKGMQFYSKLAGIISTLSFSAIQQSKMLAQRNQVEVELIEAKEKAEISEKYLDNIINNIGDPFFVKDEQSRFILVNDAFCNLFEIDRENMIGKTLAEEVPLEEQDSFLSIDKEVIKTGKENINEETFSVIGKQPKIISTRKSRYIDKNGNKVLIGTIHDITDRKHSEEKLRESEKHYQTLFNDSPIPLWEEDFTDLVSYLLKLKENGHKDLRSYFEKNPNELLNCAGMIKILDVNQATLNLLKAKSKDQLIVNLSEIFTENSFTVFMNELLALLEGKEIFESESEIKTLQGDLKNIYLTLKIDKSHADKVKALLATSDITERKQSEAVIRATEEKLSLIIDTSPIGICTVDPLGNFVMTNPTYERMLGYSKEELNNLSFYELTHPDDRPKNKKLFQDMFSLKTSDFALEKRYICKDGTMIEVSIHAMGILDAKGNTKFGTAFIEDITERKQSELALAAEKERLTVTLRSIGDGVITTDTKGNIVMLNKVAEALTGWNSKEASGNPLPMVFNIINEKTREQCENPVEKVLATGGIIELENHTCLIAKDGREIIIADSGAPIQNKESQIIGVVLVFRDMTEKKKLEDVMQNSQKLESLGILAGGIAHDFNNILGAIFGYTELAMMKTKEENVSADLAKSLSNINRARALTEQLLTFAKGGAPIKNVENLFPFVQETTQFALSGSSVSVLFQIQENLWACDFDKNKIGQVIDNLTINAQQAMPMGGAILVSAINISLSEKEHIALSPGNYVKLSIKDQGIGIPKEFLTNIFDPYYTTKPNGHGLGLATCFSIINRHDGYIEVESEPGKGSTFHIYLPATIDPVATVESKSIEAHIGNGTFLVMDDEKTNREIIKEQLESFGYTVVLKENGQDAVDFFKNEISENKKLTGIIFDLTIPGGMGGKEAIGEIRKICSETPAYVASGYSADPVMANPKNYGFNASISKPFKITELAEMLEKHMKE